MILENLIGITAGILTSISMLPQLLKVIKEKTVEDLSLPMIIILITGLSLWVWYGIIKNELPIIISNAFAVLVNLFLLSYYLRFKDK
ncbi:MULTISPECIES: SemiSWEET transporter [Sphingobacterium]|uniref:SemiSWEET transporter n=1 Tax=Sphingobacterium kitahiroshimense TaxID=470446 RepID=A0ABV0BZX0_9SPHI|nr:MULTISPECIES: SemiSWEET transporter [Sphingobacterium]MBB2950861.1 MtN3 and saliva related transmembrane protein [Sphingobacterium sp. JUb56]MCW2259287.1 MtN3 and saliva related transmembrane protein [Sphingobacterium kitahiroshimense]TCR14264.1 MtN3 and saliva related transmembrane protein [Sphingobacterium sp. JUb78]